MRFLQSETRTDQEGKPLLRDGVPVQRVSLLVRPAGGKPEVIEVNVARIEPVRLAENCRVAVRDLTVSQWSVDGRAGVSYAAGAIEPVNGAGDKQ